MVILAILVAGVMVVIMDMETMVVTVAIMADTVAIMVGTVIIIGTSTLSFLFCRVNSKDLPGFKNLAGLVDPTIPRWLNTSLQTPYPLDGDIVAIPVRPQN
jgi:hypothetical protein